MQIQSIPIDKLSVSPLNVRKHTADIDQLAASIKAIGLLTPIIVRPNGSPSTYEIVAGQRRFLAMKQLGREHIPAIISTQPDDTTSLEISLAENFSRSELDPIEACEAFMAIKASNEATTVSDLADRFGIPSKLVAQCLALADLPEAIRVFAKKKRLDMDVLKALTIAPPTLQKAWLKAAKANEWGWDNPDNILRQAVGDKPCLGDEVFDKSEYTGTFTTDLFGDKAYYNDVKQFEELQAAEAERHAEELRKEGWSWVKSYIHERDRPSLHQFGKSKNKKIAGAVVFVEKVYEEHRYVGRKLSIHTGLLDPETVRRIEKEKKKDAAAEAKGTGSDHDTEEEGGIKPQSGILSACHDALARAANAHGILALRDHSDLLLVVCDLIADNTVTFNLPRMQSEVTAIVGELIEPFPGTDAMKVKMTKSERIALLRKLLSRAATETQLSCPPCENIRKHWNPGENYFKKLDKERLAVCLDEIGHPSGEGLRTGKVKRAEAVSLLTRIFSGDEKSATQKILKAADSWVPREFLEAQAAREYTEKSED